MNLLFSSTSLVLLAAVQSLVGTVQCLNVCENNKLNVKDLIYRSQVEELAKLLDNVNKCPWNIENALKALNELVNDEDTGYCTQEYAERVRDYYFRYVHKKRSKETPKQIRRFFLAFGMRLSEACRHRMMSYLIDAQSRLSPKDFNYINGLVGRYSPMNRLIYEEWTEEKITLPKQLVKLHKINSRQLFVQTASGDRVKELQAVCQRRFKPVYSELISPLITLARVGFNFPGQELTSLVFLEDRYVYKWFRIVLLCEVLESIVIVRPKDANQDPKVIKILTRDEVAKLRPEDKTQLGADEFTDIKQIEYKTGGTLLLLGDLVWDPFYPELAIAVAFHRVSSNYDLPESRGLVKRMFALMKSNLQKKTIKLVMKNLPDSERAELTEDKYDTLLRELQKDYGMLVLNDPEYGTYYPGKFRSKYMSGKEFALSVLGGMGLAFLIIIIYGAATGSG